MQRATKYMDRRSWGWKFFCRKPFCLVFFLKIKPPQPTSEALSKFPAKKPKMGLHIPVTLAEEKYTSLLLAINKLIFVFKGKQVFPTANHIRAVKGRGATKKNGIPKMT